MKTIILIAALLLLASSQTGKFMPLTLSNDFFKDEVYLSAQAAAREVFEEKHNSQLGKVLNIEQQIVSGINYLITFDSPSGEVKVTVYSQPWTNTIKVMNIEKN